MALRIVAGRLKGRAFDGPPPGDRSLRPTSDRARQALFDVLAHAGLGGEQMRFDGAVVLDAFCGTGALAFEALSRGAARAVLMDKSPAALALARRNAARLGEAARTLLIRADATAPPTAATGPVDLCFLDPPYRQGLPALALDALARRGWIGPATLCVVETAADEEPPPALTILDARRHGAAGLTIGRLQAS